MTSLSPGVLFRSPGLNRSSTPVDLPVTPDKLHKIHTRVSFNWPADSPAARIYDVSNTSSRMILLNNRYQKSRLRGHSDTSSNSSNPDPNRHFRSPSPDLRKHEECLNSDSPHFQARPVTPVSSTWVNTKKRPPVTFANGSHVNEWHHYDCQVPSDPAWKSLEHTKNHRRRRRPKTVPASFQSNYYIQHPELGRGEKKYLWDTARVYSVANLKKLNQIRYETLIAREKHRGFFSDKDYEKYMKYIRNPRKKQFGEAESNDIPKNTNQKPLHPRSPRRQQGGTTPRKTPNSDSSSKENKGKEEETTPRQSGSKKNEQSVKLQNKAVKDKSAKKESHQIHKQSKNKENNEAKNNSVVSTKHESSHSSRSSSRQRVPHDQDSQERKTDARENAKPQSAKSNRSDLTHVTDRSPSPSSRSSSLSSLSSTGSADGTHRDRPKTSIGSRRNHHGQKRKDNLENTAESPSKDSQLETHQDSNLGDNSTGDKHITDGNTNVNKNVQQNNNTDTNKEYETEVEVQNALTSKQSSKMIDNENFEYEDEGDRVSVDGNNYVKDVDEIEY